MIRADPAIAGPISQTDIESRAIRGHYYDFCRGHLYITKSDGKCWENVKRANRLDSSRFVERIRLAQGGLYQFPQAGNQVLLEIIKTMDDDLQKHDSRVAENLVGKTVSHFEILELLGRGNRSSLYLARDVKLDRRVALKVVPSFLFKEPERKQRFMQQAQAVASLEHPNIGTIHEIDETEDGRLIVAMAHYPGETLKDRINRGSLSMEKILDYAVQLASAVDESHQHGIVHRGIKPSNIIIGDDGILRLIDFGLAEFSESSESVSYLSPEQVRNDPVDERSDIWSLGVVLFEMFVGHQPFPGEDDEALVEAILKEDPWRGPVKLIHTGNIADGLKRIIKKCLSKYGIKRYQSSRDLLDDIRKLSNKHRQKHLATLFAWNTVVVCVVIILLLVGYYSITREPKLSSRFEVVDDPFGLGQGKVLMLHPGIVDTSINHLVADLKLPEEAQIHAVEGPHQLSTLYLKIGRPDIYGEPGEVDVTWGLAAESERRHADIFNYEEYSVLARYVIPGEMEYRDGDHYRFMYPFPFDTDTYYEVWFVIDHTNNNYDLYIRGGSQFPRITQVVTAAKYRTRTLHNLDHLLLITTTGSLNIAPGGRDPVYFDDFYMFPAGAELDSPDDGWILLDNFESGEARNWKVHRTTTGPMPKRLRLPDGFF